MKKPKEKDICKGFYNSYKLLKSYNQFENNAFVFHIANEQNSNKYYTLELMRMGLTPGIADYCVLASEGKIGFLECKRDSTCKLRPTQEAFKKLCESLNIKYKVFWEIDQGIEFIKEL